MAWGEIYSRHLFPLILVEPFDHSQDKAHPRGVFAEFRVVGEIVTPKDARVHVPDPESAWPPGNIEHVSPQPASLRLETQPLPHLRGVNEPHSQASLIRGPGYLFRVLNQGV